MNKNLCLNDSERDWLLKVRSIIKKKITDPEIILPPSNEIWYLSSDGNVVTPNNANVFGANIISNTYENGRGIIKFDGDVTSIGDFVPSEYEEYGTKNIIKESALPEAEGEKKI